VPRRGTSNETEEVNHMNFTKSIGMILLSAWLILYGLIAVFAFSFQGLSLVMGVLAIAAGVLILLGR
jgi:hypothetical protein